MPKNWEARDKKLDRRKNGMRVSNRSIFTIQQVIGRKAAEAKAKEKKREGAAE